MIVELTFLDLILDTVAIRNKVGSRVRFSLFHRLFLLFPSVELAICPDLNQPMVVSGFLL